MSRHFLADFPPPGQLREKMGNAILPEFREANGHIHTPYSFSSFPDMTTLFRQAKDEKIAVLGINDFFVADGYEAFMRHRQ